MPIQRLRADTPALSKTRKDRWLLLAERNRKALRRNAEALPVREHRFVLLRAGLEGGPQPLHAIAREFGMSVESARQLERDLLEILDPPRMLDDRSRVDWHGVGVNADGLAVCCLVIHDPGARDYGEHEFFVLELGPGADEWAYEGPGRTIEEIFAGYRDEYGLVWTELTS